MSNTHRDGEILNPGKELYNLLSSIIPQDDSKSFVNKIDNYFHDDGRLADLTYYSAISYTFRRLLTFAVFIKRTKFTKDESRLIEYLREYLSSETKFPREYHEKLCLLLVECIKAQNKSIPNSIKTELMQSIKDHGALCYICGCELTDVKDQRSSAIIEHIWPQSMGGGCDRSNLALSCNDCSVKKSDYIDYYDYHYEKMSFVNHCTDSSFLISLNSLYRIAIWTKNLFKCDLCGKPSSEVGKLDFSRINSNDHWHFLNITTKCNNHTK